MHSLLEGLWILGVYFMLLVDYVRLLYLIANVMFVVLGF